MCTQISGTKVCIIYYLFAHVRCCSSIGKFVSWRFRFLRGSIHHSAAFKPLEQHEEEKEEVRSRLWDNCEDVCNGTTFLPIGRENKQDSSCIYNPSISTQAKPAGFSSCHAIEKNLQNHKCTLLKFKKCRFYLTENYKGNTVAACHTFTSPFKYGVIFHRLLFITNNCVFQFILFIYELWSHGKL